MLQNTTEHKRTVFQILVFACQRGLCSILWFGCILLVLAFFVCGLEVFLVILDRPVTVFILGALLIIGVAVTGTPAAFIAGFVTGMLYAVSESFRHRLSYTTRMKAGIGMGSLLALVMPIVVITIFQPFQWGSWVQLDAGGQLIASGFIAGLMLGGIAAGIDWLFLAGREANSYRKNHAHSH